ncbi:OmpH family outer membrane protein [uncultured Psychroserpens sp.]|uniref:OmpH family outer membrane protein n=1 Tax=uncultured Psychroserpens sp. TaxID=255436 RepID=UPI0026024D5C|nr:OmpH family outer membrane protein [uncultured Psychroserpens sp.]
MKKIVSVLVFVLALVSCQDQQKIAFIDNGEVINAYQEKIDIETKYKLKDEDFKKRADSIGQAFQLEVQNFQLGATKLSERKQQEQGQALGQKQQLLQQQLQREQQNLTNQFNVEMDSVVNRVEDFVSAYGKTNGYSFILGRNEAGSVLYGTEANDITKIIIEAINTDYKNKQ